MLGQPPRIPSQQRLIAAIWINLLATPGLGSLLARRRVAGWCQLTLALAGCGLILSWIFDLCYKIMLRQLNGSDSGSAPGWLWRWGVGLFAAGWLWALLTSWGIWRQAKAL